MTQTAKDQPAQPRALLSVPDGIFLMVGMVLGVGIFKAPSMVAGNTADAYEFLGAWPAGSIRFSPEGWAAGRRFCSPGRA
jgi:hypothetical protein